MIHKNKDWSNFWVLCRTTCRIVQIDLKSNFFHITWTNISLFVMRSKKLDRFTTVAQFFKQKQTWASRQVCRPGAEQADKFVGLVWISVWPAAALAAACCVSVSAAWAAGLPDFSATTYQNGKNIPNNLEIYQMSIKYGKWL
jgi:hypothetical protein